MVNTYTTSPVGLDIESTNSANAPTGKGPETYPYRRGLSCILRGCFGTFSTAVLGLTVYLLSEDVLGENIAKSTYAAPLVAAALSVLINYFALILSILRRYGTQGYWRWMLVADPVVMALAFWSFVMFGYSIRDQVIAEEPKEDYRGRMVEDMKPMLRELIAVTSLLIALFHLIATLGNLWGLRLVANRRKAFEQYGPSALQGSKLLAWANPHRSNKVTHTGYPAPN
ncbi:hypothetical protein B0T14DRAFT_569213 [Immersiella caudata]|uniref:Uncharacterized protein n=1 Tax=Immersiella caudata TaxID=314043 RepID=A0AA39WLS0_9PEZI|nr:hypothetical protein B0T14DRAFT_569213 [Immersiella caudata]